MDSFSLFCLVLFYHPLRCYITTFYIHILRFLNASITDGRLSPHRLALQSLFHLHTHESRLFSLFHSPDLLYVFLINPQASFLVQVFGLGYSGSFAQRRQKDSSSHSTSLKGSERTKANKRHTSNDTQHAELDFISA